MAKQLRIVQDNRYGTGTFAVVKKLGPRICLKDGSVGQFFPLNVSQLRGGANLAEKTPRWCNDLEGGARRGGAN